MSEKRIARVFPRKTNASPEDDLAFFGKPPEDVHVDEVHVSVTFSYDLKRAEELAELWKPIAPVTIGGPATGDPGGQFEPGMYLKKGYVMTSRGCPNKCWFCDVPKREGDIRELVIEDGWNILDSNILACSDDHIRAVFKMLSRQEERVHFTGGLEAARIKPWHVAALWELRPSQIFFAYDTPDDLEPLRNAAIGFNYADFTRRHLRCYVLIGFPKDTMENAQIRLFQVWEAGFMPMAMLYRDKEGKTDPEWRKFQKVWARPAIIRSRMKEEYSSLWEK